MPFPDDFYYFSSQIQSRNTDKPTSVIDPRLNLEKPFLEFKKIPNNQCRQPKTLIFADHFFNFRSPSQIQETLEKAKMAGFKIFFLKTNGIIEEWDGKIPEDYTLDAEQFTEETIRDLAWQQHRLNADHLVVLDHFRLNQLMDPETLHIPFSATKTSLLKLDAATPKHDESIMVYTNGEKEIQQFIDFPTQKLRQMYLHLSASNLHTIESTINSSNKIVTQLSIQKKYFDKSLLLDEKQIDYILKLAPSLKRIELDECAITEKVIEKLENHSFPVLEKITLTNCTSIFPPTPMGSPEEKMDIAISDLFTNAPRLKSISANRTAFYCFPERFLQQINSIEFTDDLHEDFLKKLKESAGLKKITFKRKLLTKDLKPHSLDQLEEIHLTHIETMDINSLQLLLGAASQVQAIYFNCVNLPKLHKKTHSILETNLPNLKILEFKTDPNTHEIDSIYLNTLLQRAPNLESLVLKHCNIKGILQPPREGLKHLRYINLCSALSLDNLSALFQSAPNLEEINLEIGRYFRDKSGLRHFTDGLSNLFLSHKKLRRIVTEVGVFILGKDRKLQCVARGKDILPSLLHDPNQKKMPPPTPIPQPDEWKPSGPLLSKQEKNRVLPFTEYFPGISASYYRLRVWNPVFDEQKGEITYEKPKQTFESIPLKDKKDYPEKKYISHPGILTVTPKAEKEIILPSLDPDEKLYELTIVDRAGRVIKPHSIEYCKQTRFYRVNLTEPGDYTIRFKVAIPYNTPKIPDLIDDLVKSYQKTSADLPESFHPKNTKELIDAVIQCKAGRCDQRSLAACYQLQKILLKTHHPELIDYVIRYKTGKSPQHSPAMWQQLQKKYKEKVRIVYNDVHTFLEMNIGGEWQTLDVGGVPCRPQKVETAILEEKKQEHISFTALPFTLPRTTVSETKEIKDSDELKKHEVIPIPSPAAFQQFLASLKTSTSLEDVYLAHRPEELSLTSPGIATDGKVIENAFSRWLNNRKKGIIYIDSRDFSASEIARLNDILDRRVGQKALPPDIKMIVLDKPFRPYGEDFKRRCRLTQAPSLDISPLLKTLDQKDQKKEEKILEIDLFNSPFWQRDILGSWKLKPEADGDYSFTWENGLFLNEISKTPPPFNKVVFKNPPLNDPTFTTFIAKLQSLRYVEYADQKQAVPEKIEFLQSTGYDWAKLLSQASLVPLQSTSTIPFVLSDTNILSFIQKKEKPCYLERFKNQVLDIVCTYQLLDDTLAQLLTEATKHNVRIRFHVSSKKTIQPKLSTLAFDEKMEAKEVSPSVSWQVHPDSYFQVRLLQKTYPKAFYVDMRCLEPSELSHYNHLKNPEKLRKKGRIQIKSVLSDILKKLQNNETVILGGPIPVALYPKLTALSLGHIDGKPFPGKLIIVTSPDQSSIAEAISGKKPLVLDSKYTTDLASEEQRRLQHELSTSIPAPDYGNKRLSDEDKSKLFDNYRSNQVEKALEINPWVMLPGPTGVGKTHYLNSLSSNKKTFTDLNQWLDYKDAKEEAILIVDEANFSSQLDLLGENFLERFKSLRNNPPGFLWKGEYHQLTPQHKVIFAFNPTSYGAGREPSEFLEKHALNVHFERLPHFYIRGRLIKPLLEELLPHQDEETLNQIAGPLVSVYEWMMKNSDAEQEVLMTPRHLKSMIYLIANQIIEENITDERTLKTLSEEVAFFIGKQAIQHKQTLLNSFVSSFKSNDPARFLISQKTMPALKADQLKKHQLENYQFKDYQQATYSQLEAILASRKLLTKARTDPGLGCVILEGKSGIGKSQLVKFIEAALEEREEKNICRIEPHLDISEKAKKLKEACENGAIVIAEEMNTGDWPKKLLNNLLMGLDEKGLPVKKPGFMLIATQNPPSFSGRSGEEDVAFRQRSIIFELNWPRLQERQPEMKLDDIKKSSNPAQLFHGPVPLNPAPSPSPAPPSSNTKLEKR